MGGKRTLRRYGWTDHVVSMMTIRSVAFLPFGFSLLTGCDGTYQSDYDPMPESFVQAPPGLTGLPKGDGPVGAVVGAKVCRAAVSIRHQIPVDQITVVETFDGNFVTVDLGGARSRRVCLVDSNSLVSEAADFSKTSGSSEAMISVFTISGDRVVLRPVGTNGALAPPIQRVVLDR